MILTSIFLASVFDCKKYEPQQVKYLVKTISSYCTHAYCISKYGARFLLNNLPFNKGVDSEIDAISIRENLFRYATYTSYFIQDVKKFPSHLRPKKLYLKNAIQCR